MLLYELHNALARTIGDPVENTGSLFVDGVRFSTQLRAQYLYQAMNDIVMGAVQKVAPVPHIAQSEILERMFPSMVTAWGGTVPVDIRNAAFILSAFYISLSSGNPVSLPIVRSFQALRTSLGRNTTLQPSDPFLLFLSTDALQVTGGNTESLAVATVSINYIKRPPMLEWLYDVANAGNEMNTEFEGMWAGEMLRKASLMAQIDSGEIGTSAQAYQLTALSPLSMQ
jgi:hypothetical protein